MLMESNYFEINKKSWNKRTPLHVNSDFYDVAGFLNGQNSLNDIELTLLGDVKGKKILHLQCHFGQDTLSLRRMGARVTGVDFSDKAIEEARNLAQKAGLEAQFICCNVYDLPQYLDEQFDIVFTSYGTITWLPDLNEWAKVIAHFLKPNGKFVLAEFHPFIWAFDNDFEGIAYPYFNRGAFVAQQTGTYAAKNAAIKIEYVFWNHSVSETFNALVNNGLRIDILNEYDYSPYDCCAKMVAIAPKKFQIIPFGDKAPLVYAIQATKTF
jgi:ubiquinone/menaquinone biosynthesis C-methylase UbiE